MSTTLNVKITKAGLAALINADNTGVDLDITDISLGDGVRVMDGTESALTAEKSKVAIASGASPADGVIQLRAIFRPTAGFWVREIGIW